MIGFHELYAAHARDVYRFALFLCGDPSTADDLTADTFVRAWTASGSIREPTVRAYLLTITRNLWRDRKRRERRLVPLDDAMGESRAFEARAEHAIDLRWTEKLLKSVANGDRWLHIPPSTGIFFLGGIIIFLFGLISEQIASLRFKGPEL